MDRLSLYSAIKKQGYLLVLVCRMFQTRVKVLGKFQNTQLGKLKEFYNLCVFRVISTSLHMLKQNNMEVNFGRFVLDWN